MLGRDAAPQLSFILSLVVVSFIPHSSQTPPPAFRRENFDPRRADRSEAISCIGPLPSNYEGLWPELRGYQGEPFDPATETLENICAKPQYGGDPRGHIGGWCFTPTQPLVRSDGPHVVFDNSIQSGSSRELSTMRMQAYCLQHCFCNYGGRVTTPPTLKGWQIRRVPSAATVMLEVGPAIEWGSRKFLPPGKDGAYEVDTLIISKVIQTAPADRRNRHIYQLSLNPNNKITCDGELPNWVYPGGHSSREYDDLQELCATIYDGGHHDANAGGMCLWHETEGPVYFPLDEFTPALEWKESEWPGSMPIKLWCQMHCTCDIDRKPPKVDWLNVGAELPWMTGHVKIDDRGGGLSVRVTFPDEPDQESLVQFYAPEGGSNYQAGAQSLCSSSSGCPANAARPANFPRYRRPPTLNSIFVEPQPTRQRMTDLEFPTGRSGGPDVCGASCTGPRDCSNPPNSPDAGSCRCVVFPTSKLLENGKAAFAKVASCLVIESIGRNSRARLGGRDLSNSTTENGWSGDQWGCACNSTYVSRGCCDAGHGMVWEAPGLNLGEL